MPRPGPSDPPEPSQLLGTLPLGSLEARSARTIRIEEVLSDLVITLPFQGQGGNLMLEFTIGAAGVRGAAQVFNNSLTLAFGVYPLQEISSASNTSPTVLVANFINGNTDVFRSRVYLWNPSTSAGTITVRVFTMPRPGPSDPPQPSQLLGTLPLGTLEARSARTIRIEEVLTDLGITLPYQEQGGNLMLEFTIGAAGVRGAAQVFNNSLTLAFGTYPLQEIVGQPAGEPSSALYPQGQKFDEGTSPLSVAVADLNADGIPDLVTANGASDDVSVLLGSGDGTFQAQQTFPVGTNPQSVAAADLNADGVPDLVTANAGSNDVSVLLGSGGGTFQAQQTFPVGSGPFSVAVADLNTDGVPDLVTANAGSNDVSVLLGSGGGTFQAQQTFPVGDSQQSVAAADLNADGIPDLVTANRFSDNVSVLLGNGDGTFQAQQSFPVGDRPFLVAVADLNADGVPDLVTANAGSNDVSVLLGNGDGTFQAQQTFPVGNGPQSVAAADLNTDGVPDLVTANRFSDNVSVLLHQ